MKYGGESEYSYRTDSLLPFESIIENFETLKHSKILNRKNLIKFQGIGFTQTTPVSYKQGIKKIVSILKTEFEKLKLKVEKS